ncbi:MAG: hypothetical protein KTR32_17210 [Granulosicoccus sp.]|nr:hypothetical protein [Granulosicoccus sp.]
MKPTLPATHLLRQYLLFVLTAVFLLTVMRSAYGLWQFPKLEQTSTIINLFVQGLRFDLALIGIIALVPVVLGTLLSMSNATRWLAKFLITVFLLGGLVLILFLELLTPWFLDTQGLRPDIDMLSGVPTPAQTATEVFQQHMIPVIIGLVLCLLIIIAFWSRMEIGRFLRYRVSVSSALLLALVGGLICLVAIWSTPDLRKPALSPGDSLISTDSTVNDLAMNSAYKSLYSLALPYLNR